MAFHIQPAYNTWGHSSVVQAAPGWNSPAEKWLKFVVIWNGVNWVGGKETLTALKILWCLFLGQFLSIDYLKGMYNFISCFSIWVVQRFIQVGYFLVFSKTGVWLGMQAPVKLALCSCPVFLDLRSLHSKGIEPPWAAPPVLTVGVGLGVASNVSSWTAKGTTKLKQGWWNPGLQCAIWV